MIVKRFIAIAALGMAALSGAQAYPIDGFDRTEIRRLEFYRLAQLGELRGRQLPAGARLDTDAITLAYPAMPTGSDGKIELPDANPVLSSRLTELLMPEDQPRYGIAVLDYTRRTAPVYAEHNGQMKSNVGSVGKLLVGIALMHELAEAWPDSVMQRERVLRDTIVTADSYVQRDHHRVPIFDVDTRHLDFRRLQPGDSGNLWEWLDWMFSASSNGAASMVVQQATLLDHFGSRYGLAPQERAEWLESLDPRSEGKATVDVLTGALESAGLDTGVIRQGSYFTGVGKRAALGTTSYATPQSLVQVLAMIETGTLVDTWSSLELKRLLYMTERRIRYASHPALHDSAVFFKSGSLYGCKEEPGYTCGKYKGNRINILASVAIIESPADAKRNAPPMRYAVAVVSNVLYKNSAVAHQTLAMRIHRLLQELNSSPDSPVSP